MLPYYKTVKEFGAAEIVIKKSRFIGHAKPVASEDEAVQFIEMIKKEHWSATHNCSAYMIGERDEIQKQSDDGEPSGTAGKPILEVIKNQGLKNVVVVVTRYFGGIMLGAGGLIRAYTDGAVEGIAAAGPVYQVLHRVVQVEMDYTWHGKVENELRNRGTMLGDTEFTDKVTVTCMPLAGEAERFAAWITDVTQGQSVIRLGAERYSEHTELPSALT
ncbi:YigZ family protein [Paenibacillus xerothermodurans]|uniref:YigZ family protein n=1 Tax=Paenibacillus xerothermodurans TaxID=1977292 RepID=A0A2W1NAC1_PAEXE|nr:YigZ family protein [Paenibacillus xerothermodurans]PZE20874.1 YigZ family protein [Paenibacillus xerothermodurans]